MNFLCGFSGKDIGVHKLAHLLQELCTHRDLWVLGSGSEPTPRPQAPMIVLSSEHIGMRGFFWR